MLQEMIDDAVWLRLKKLSKGFLESDRESERFAYVDRCAKKLIKD